MGQALPAVSKYVWVPPGCIFGHVLLLSSSTNA